MSLPGTYKLIVTNTENNCIDSAATVLEQDTAKPAAVTAVNDGPFTCVKDSVTLSGNSLTIGVEYSWTGPGNFTSAISNPTVNTAGDYTLVVTHPISGCIDSAVTNVPQNIVTPDMDVTFTSINNETFLTDTVEIADLVLNCYYGFYEGNVSSATSGAIYKWIGPLGETNGSQNFIFDQGKYVYIVEDPINGCIIKDSVDK